MNNVDSHEMARRSRRDSVRFTISIAAEMVEVHAQTLRHYERIGLIAPKRSEGKIRYYTLEDIERLDQIKHLIKDREVNLNGVKINTSDSERTLRSLLANIRDVAVFEVPTPLRKELWAAVVRDGPIERDALTHAVDKARVERAIFLERLPLSQNGKVSKAQLASLALDVLAKNPHGLNS